VVEIDYRRQLGETPSLEDYSQHWHALPPEWVAQVLTLASQPAATPGPAGVSQEPWAPGIPLGTVGDYAAGEDCLGRHWRRLTARQISLNRPVALKMIRSAQLASDVERTPFRSEALAVALDHSHNEAEGENHMNRATWTAIAFGRAVPGAFAGAVLGASILGGLHPFHS